MSPQHTPTRRTILSLLPLGLLAVTASFVVGVQTSGTLQTIQWSSANETPRGDINADGMIDAADVILILETAQGYRSATPDELAADPNGNGILAVDDAIRILRTMTSSSR